MRIVISLTTTAKRIKSIKDVLLSILQQTCTFDVLYVNIEKGCSVPCFLTNLANLNKRVIINFCERDYGPITKLVPTLQVERDPDTLILICDDDQLWAKNTLEYFIEGHKKFPDDAISMSGWCVGKFPFIFQLCLTTQDSQLVDWIEGTNGILIRRDMLDVDELLDYSGLSPEFERLFFKNDDHWITYHLHKRNINRRKLMGNARDFFKQTNTRHINPLSGQSGFFINVFKIARTLKFYNKSAPVTLHTSLIGFSIIAVLLIVLYTSFR